MPEKTGRTVTRVDDAIEIDDEDGGDFAADGRVVPAALTHESFSASSSFAEEADDGETSALVDSVPVALTRGSLSSVANRAERLNRNKTCDVTTLPAALTRDSLSSVACRAEQANRSKTVDATSLRAALTRGSLSSVANCAEQVNWNETGDVTALVGSVPTPSKHAQLAGASKCAEHVELGETYAAKEKPETDDVESLYRMMSSSSTICKSMSISPSSVDRIGKQSAFGSNDDLQHGISSRSLQHGRSSRSDLQHGILSRSVAADQIEINVGKWDGSKSLGMNLHVSEDGLLIIRSVTGGLMQAYNATAEEKNLQVMASDAIVAINGRFGEAADLLAYFRGHDSTKAAAAEGLRLCIQRPRMHSIEIHKAHAPVGLSVDHEPIGLRVSSVKAGMFSNWNVGLKGSQLKRNDRIVRVNGRQCQSQEMLNDIKVAAVQHRPLSLSFLRY